jgi:serine/threonine protein kinase
MLETTDHFYFLKKEAKMGCCESTIQPSTRIVTMDHSVKDIWAIYDKIKMLGQGGFAVTYEAKHKISRETHASKLMPKAHERASNPKETFEREVDILSNESRPGIVAFKGAYEDQVYFARLLNFLEEENFLIEY